jgi:hypothetical protein
LNIKQLLKQDFGYDLDISGESGQSSADPIFILSGSTKKAADTQYLFLKGLGRGRKILWRTIDIDLYSDEIPKLIKHQIETKYVTEDEVITTTENYYFLWKSADFGSPADSHSIAHFDKDLGIKFQKQISWLHFQEIINNEEQHPGLGYTLSYGGLGIKATIYVYPFPDSLEHPANYLDELKNARSGIVKIYGREAIEHDWDIVEGRDHAFYTFIPKNDPKNISGIMVTNVKEHFVKVRFTHFDEGFMREIAGDFLDSVLDVLRKTKASSN